MLKRCFAHRWRAITALLLLMMAGMLWLSGQRAQAAPLAQATVTIDIPAVEDAGVIESVPTFGAPGNPYFVLNSRPGGDFDHNFMRFDLSAIPVDAVIDSAQLELYVNAAPADNPLDVEIGQVDGEWSQTTLNWNNQPAVIWRGSGQTVTAVGPVSWPIKPLLEAWLDGSQPNDGVAIRGQTPATGGVLADTIDAADDPTTDADGFPPRLVVTYSRPLDTEDARPDLGDAPDSTNHHGQPNTAYVAAAILGQFPTVYDVPANQVAGPLHDNLTGEGILGQFISREREADQGADEDGPKNILRGAGGAIGDVADNDRGDDGWRNRNLKFFDCRQQTLTVRVSKDSSATLRRMYLNVWFDGNRDGDWADIAPCADPNGGPNQATYEWIVQDHIIDMTAIPSGGYLDFNIDTERVLNDTPALPHWMRFTLSEERAVQPLNGDYPDGRGPHPDSAQKSFRFGETEDVLQTPPPPGEAGELVIEKRVITSEEPVDYAGVVIYQIRLRHEGGTEPIEAQIRDQIGYPQHLPPQIDDVGNIVYVQVTSPTGGAAPLTADLDYVQGDTPGVIEQLIAWQGTLSPDAEILLTFDVHVHPLCEFTIAQTKTITNLAEARMVDGDPITAEASFVAKCPGYDAAGGIEFDIDSPVGFADGSHVPWQGTVWNKHPISVTLGVYQELSHTDTTTPTSQVRSLGTLTLGPDEKRPISFDLRLEDDGLSGDLDDRDPSVGRLYFCILNGEDNRCANAEAYPNLQAEIVPPVWIPQPEELGDAPDSTNHFAGVAMTAYPGVQANFPTVFDPATGPEQGPKHSNPRPLHLGLAASREAEADLGPDADGVNNIWPPANAADQDWFDDGAQLSNVVNCQPARVDVRVDVNQQAVNWFDNNDRVAYLNVWLDSNHDGDWAGGFTCVDEAGQNKEVVEHILIDYPVDVAALGVGLHSLANIATERVAWPAQGAQDARWIRFTLSEEPSDKPLSFGAIQYGDGRGPATPFRTGETEDYLWLPNGAGGGPDLAARIAGDIVRQPQDGHYLRLKIDYANRGDALASGALLRLSKDEAMRDAALQRVLGPGLQPGDVTDDAEQLTIALPDLMPNESSSLVVSFGPLTAVQVAAAAVDQEYGLSVQIELAGDANPSNNEASLTVAVPSAPLRLAASAESDDLLRKADSTCRDEVMLQGRGEAGQNVNLIVDGTSNTLFQMDADGVAQDLRLTILPAGRHLLWLAEEGSAVTSPRDAASGTAVGLTVDPGLPVDPITLLLTDSQGRPYHPPTLGWSRGATNDSLWRLRPGETYDISIRSCVNDPNLSLKIVMSDVVISSLRDDDGDGTYTGRFTYEAPVQVADAAAVNVASQLRLLVRAGGVEQSFEAEILPRAEGIVRAAVTGQPLAEASVSALVANDGADYSALTAVESSEPDAQTTGADGAYGFTVADGSYRLVVVRDGYQPYYSDNTIVTDGALAADINLSPAIDEVANHVVYITANGFEPNVINAKPGDVVLWINADLAEHATIGDGWASGLLAMSEGYKVRFAEEGAFGYADGENAGLSGSVVVKEVVDEPDDPDDPDNPDNPDDPDDPDDANPIFLPLVRH